MLTSIKKFTGSFLAKILIGLIILPFVFWWMGDVFRGGNQNVIATIDSEKISVKEFLNFLNRVNLTEEQRKDLSNSDLIEKILSNYIGNKIIKMETEDMGIRLTDSSLRDIIINDETFFNDKKFSRTKYEKFLIESNLTAPDFEKRLADSEKKRQLLSFLSEGIIVPEFLIENAFRTENQIKNIDYIDLNILYNSKKIKDEEIEKVYNENKDLFSEEFKKISFIELKPEIIVGQGDFNKTYFDKINTIENEILDGKKIEKVAKENNLKLVKTENVNMRKLNVEGKRSKIVSDELFSKVFNMKNINEPELINLKNKYYLAEIDSVKKISPGAKDSKVKESITAQLKIQNIFENNTEISKKIREGKFDESTMVEYAQKNKLEVKNIRINGLKDNKVFNENIIKEIFKTRNKQINLISDTLLTKNYLIIVNDTEKIKLDKNSENYKKYKSMAKLRLTNEIYKSYDDSVNAKYKIDVNNKVVKRIKNSL